MGKFVNSKKKRDREEEVAETTTKSLTKNPPKRKKDVVAEESPSEEEHGSESEGSNDENSNDSADEGNGGGGDGLANTMAALLKQTTSSKVPVLAGRKTSIMKQMEAQKKDVTAQLRKREERRSKIREKMDSSVINMELEKQLKKLATKGVVALFNAVAKAKRDSMMEETLKKKKFNEEETVVSRDNTFNSGSLVKKSDLKQPTSNNKGSSKGWKVVDDNADEVPMDWDKDEYED